MSARIPGGEKQLLRGHIPLRFSRALSVIRSMFNFCAPCDFGCKKMIVKRMFIITNGNLCVDKLKPSCEISSDIGNNPQKKNMVTGTFSHKS